MMSKEDAQTPAGGQSNRKTAAAAARPQDQQNLKCPRCDSPNTKFCYYNNYSLTQPRHFCKTCRRYWTKGGALRNVPIGGGCRKNKKVKSSSSSSRLSSDSASKLLDTSSSSDFGGLKFFHGLVSPAMDFQLGGSGLSFPSNNSLDPSLMGFNNNTNNYPVINPPHASNGFLLGGAIQGMGSLNVNSSLASSIESLSSINQDLHWKLQQQRLGVLFGSGEINTNHQKGTATAVSAAAARAVVSPVVTLESQVQKPQPILFQNLDVSKPDGNSNLRKEGGNGESSNAGATEWFFGNSYAPVAGSSTPTNSSGNGNDHNNTSGNWNNGVQLWSDLHHQYSGLP